MNIVLRLLGVVALTFLLTLDVALAQGTRVALGGLQLDASQPVEVTADALAVDQNDQSVTFTGNVLVGQGSMRLSAAKIHVEYVQGEGDTQGEIRRMTATGGVTFTNGGEAAEARSAVYELLKSTLTLRGDVILTQGNNALSGQTLVVDLETGTGAMQGRVKTILNAGTGE